MSIEFLPHTADVKIKVTADSLESLFKEAVAALYQYLKPKAKVKKPKRQGLPQSVIKQVKLQAFDLTSLLIDFLSEILSLTYIEKMKFQVRQIKLIPSDPGIELKAVLSGERFEQLEDDIKAVTYHQAEMKKIKGGWKAVFIVDV